VDVTFAEHEEVASALREGSWTLVLVDAERLPLDTDGVVAALVETEDEAPGAIGRGADHVLCRPARRPMLEALLGSAARDMARRRRAAAYRTAVEHASEGIEITDAQSRYVDVNRSFTAMSGYTREEALGHTPRELLRGDVHDDGFYEAIWKQVTGGEPWVGAMVGRRKDGTYLHYATTIVPVLDAAGERHHFAALKRPRLFGRTERTCESTDLWAAFASAADSDARHREMIAVARDAIVVADDASGNVVDANPAALSLYGRSLAQLYTTTVRDLLGDVEGNTARHVVRAPDGEETIVSVRVSRFRVGDGTYRLMIARDLTDVVKRERALERSHERLRQAEVRMHQSARLADIGRVAAAVAHEINNPLQFVLSSVDALHAEEDRGARAELLDDVRAGVKRVASIAADLLPFARQTDAEMVPVDLVEVVRRACRMTSNELRHHATLVKDLDELPSMLGDAQRLAQVVTNLLVNAARSIPPGRAGENEIRVRASFDGELVLQVTDTGRGMTAEEQRLAFEPFFTTRDEGTGLGLALAREIVDTHGGTITIESQPGAGTTVEVRFPPGRVSDVPEEVAETPSVPGGLRVLLVDDEPLVLKSYQRLLARIAPDAEVGAASSGEEALDLLTRRTFDVMVCDVMMPTMDGVSLYRAVRASAPQLRVVFCSGGVFDGEARRFLESEGLPVLVKPVEAAQLRRALVGD